MTMIKRSVGVDMIVHEFLEQQAGSVRISLGTGRLDQNSFVSWQAWSEFIF